MNFEPLISDLADDPDMAELLEEFVRGLGPREIEIQSALNSKDVPTLRRVGHQLKGSGGGYGFQALTDAGDRLERAALVHADSSEGTLGVSAMEVLEVIRRIRAGFRQ